MKVDNGGGAVIHKTACPTRGRYGLRTFVVVGALLLAACGTAAASTLPAAQRRLTKTVLVGASLSLTGDFASNGQEYVDAYKLWARQVNASGGLLGRKVVLKILNDTSSPTQVATNYEDLITVYHAPLLLGPFSSLLTVPSARIAQRYGYAMITGSGGAPGVFDIGLKTVFDASAPVVGQSISLAHLIAAMPKKERPRTAAYVTSNSIFALATIGPPKAILQRAGVKTLYYKVWPSEITDLSPLADSIAATRAQVVFIAETTPSHLVELLKTFIADHYNPELISATSGVFGGTLKAALGANSNGVIEAAGWYPSYKNSVSEAFVKAYTHLYHVSALSIAPTTAEAYSAAEVLTAAVKATHSFNQQRIIAYLRRATIPTVQGPARFNKLGENVAAAFFQFQWQDRATKEVLIAPPRTPGAGSILFPKPHWVG